MCSSDLLWTVWDRYFPRRPDYPNRTHVESRIAYKLQEEAFGGLAPETKQRLEAIGAKHSKIKLRAKPREFDFAPGTILLREWGEREHRVTVTAEGLVVRRADGTPRTLPADTVVTALPLRPNAAAEQLASGRAAEVHTIGDAADPQLIVDAIAAGAKVGHAL